MIKIVLNKTQEWIDSKQYQLSMGLCPFARAECAAVNARKRRRLGRAAGAGADPISVVD